MDSEDRTLVAIAVILYSALAMMIYVASSSDVRWLVVAIVLYVGLMFGLFGGYILSRITSRGWL